MQTQASKLFHDHNVHKKNTRVKTFCKVVKSSNPLKLLIVEFETTPPLNFDIIEFHMKMDHLISCFLEKLMCSCIIRNIYEPKYGLGSFVFHIFSQSQIFFLVQLDYALNSRAIKLQHDRCLIDVIGV